MKIKRALISVSDKTGVTEFAKSLHELGIDIISTGGTMKAIKDAGIPVTYVSEITGFPEIMDGRVKTLNPYIHGGILALRDNPKHIESMQEHDITGIDLVVVNLYPFRETIQKPDVTLEDAIENIDIGGPAMIRAAAKNFKHVVILVNPKNYAEVLNQLKSVGDVDQKTRMALAKEAFTHTSEYDACINNYLDKQLNEDSFVESLQISYEKIQTLRYGENPHQKAAFYREKYSSEPGVANAVQLQGKELSYNNIVDVDAAYNIVNEFEEPTATIIKHTNPCGTGIGKTIFEAYQKAYDADPVSAFGGIVALNKTVDKQTAEKMSEIFLEVIIAPDFTEDALLALSKKQNLRLLKTPMGKDSPDILALKSVNGGIVVQSKDDQPLDTSSLKVVTEKQPTKEEYEQMLFAFKIVKHVKSNAIVVAKDNKTIGVGAGQMNRVGSAAIALNQAQEEAKGAVMASDAFFPFTDTVIEAAKAGITAIIQPGGSIRDEDSIKAANEHNIAMVFTGVRHFKH
ncbi:bifunctional phosphoribosylaminoimidazolecarboxamide formyltransferase/IMP cyclohydrolase [Selenomonadales bacterium OttesenSCG-928-I06]|nr:bifunctional phosphoribosylaminoimidazolecarboxamide formyltransferase/IMP cyclohydrolase [Selenomonadales bacterium OttesenSCG-928-I06]